MVTVEEALSIISRETACLDVETISTELAVGRTLANHVLSTIAMPPFDQSAMDGYALGPTDHSGQYLIVAEIPAGSNASNIVLQSGECARIFTGSMIPNNCRTVIQQELTEREGNIIQIEAFPDGKNIRRTGEQFQQNETIVSKSTVLNPGTIGFLLSAGISSVEVIRKPRVTIITTGSELVQSGTKLMPGQIFESNSGMLRAAFQIEGIDVSVLHVTDNIESLNQAVRDTENVSDLLIFSGGISVGDYDFVREATQQNKVLELFYKVKQKPGKPLYFGKKNKTLYFGLPGNPSSALTCFYVYVRTALSLMQGRNALKKQSFQLLHDYEKQGTFTNLLRAKVNGNTIEILERQSSAELNAWSQTNAIVILPAERNNFHKGDILDAFIINPF